MNFLVCADDRIRDVRTVFATEADLSYLKSWQRVPVNNGNPHARDAIAFSKLACRWWQYYARQGSSATSLQELKDGIGRRPKQETAFLVLAKADWHERSPVIGFCCCRRTWCNHIVLEFAAVNPLILNDPQRNIRGIGTGMLSCLIQIADELGVETIWGETTEHSAPFYEKVLGVPNVQDHFFITGPVMDHIRERLGVIKNAHDASKGLSQVAKYATVSYNEARGESKKARRALGVGVPASVLRRQSAQPKRLCFSYLGKKGCSQKRSWHTQKARLAA